MIIGKHFEYIKNDHGHPAVTTCLVAFLGEKNIAWVRGTAVCSRTEGLKKSKGRSIAESRAMTGLAKSTILMGFEHAAPNSQLSKVFLGATKNEGNPVGVFPYWVENPAVSTMTQSEIKFYKWIMAQHRGFKQARPREEVETA